MDCLATKVLEPEIEIVTINFKKLKGWIEGVTVEDIMEDVIELLKKLERFFQNKKNNLLNQRRVIESQIQNIRRQILNLRNPRASAFGGGGAYLGARWVYNPQHKDMNGKKCLRRKQQMSLLN